MKRPRITVVGSVNADMVVATARLPAPGETVTGGRFLMAAGGKGANQAVAAARLGADVTLIAKVGRDPFGEAAIAGFRREGICTDHIFIDETSATGVALITVDERGENQIAVASGANANFSLRDIEQCADVIRKSEFLLVQLEIPIETLECTTRIAAEAGVTVILDPAPAMFLPNEIIETADYLTPNETEAAQLTGVAITDETSARVAVERLLAAGPRNVIVKMGAAGALLATSSTTSLVPSTMVSAVDTTAAGDAFSGALAWSLGQGATAIDAVRLACLAGALSATRVGAQPSLPTGDDLRRFAAERAPGLRI
ncbi:MAG TPA: ribokinase [Pirellulales bacterium]|nr:ribokinase [Pirellulales bacterium]